MIVTDLHGFSLAKHGDSQVSRKFVEILQDHYPERLHSMVAINAPAIFVGFYKALSVFIDKTTRKKFQVKGKMDKKAAHEYLTQYITQDQLEDCYDGVLPTKVPPNIVEILEPLWEQHKSAKKRG
ncbi:hypothetical protein, variant [Sphaeroforma arctica JP610]|nr:hypothetical protein, variant [Sphaeroforma arctica JP610]KNC77282.1 hypothetical protein, variant [Sphaeroforma arctica JP610]|eukprot:XP_014151184.1 hypothetical protein, variant [Sphaeroforma arctica JP610]